MACHRICARLLTAVAVSFFGLAQVAGQSINGSITGSVTGQSGAVISAATVALRNPRTNLVDRMDSNESEVNSFLSLPIGDYELKVESKGFKPAVLRSLIVETAQMVWADLFNVFNRRNLYNPVSDVTNANFGRINGQSNHRVMPSGFRFDF
ncbi:MAG: carboxypeptidase regulatory-like domain-containing protein [Bryobacterales bacterium]|nr:carboxypeptidase regulatory-like domain-containing protein [Bryobacterales bacterium]